MPQPGPKSRDYKEVGIFLAPQFPLYALVPIIEALRIANHCASRRLFNWTFISETGGPVESGAGMTINCDTNIYSGFSYDLVLVLSGINAVSFLNRNISAWLQNLYSHGMFLGGIDTGAFALAEAGLLNGRRATIHWEALRIFSERYPDVDIVERRYIIDPPLMTCAGGVATYDLMLEYVERECGPVLARQLADGFVYPDRGRADGPQRGTPEHGHETTNDLVSLTIKLMEETIETPLSVAEISRQLGVARRNLERLFAKRTQSSIAQYYMRVRLERARELLFYGQETINEISLICGFSSPTVFTRTFRTHFGQTPTSFRTSYSAAEMARFRPHVAWTLSETRRQRR